MLLSETFNENYLQLFVEYENQAVHVDIHLAKFNKKNAREIFNSYIEKYRNKEINQLFMKFWDKGIAGDYLSLWRKNNSDDNFLVQPLTGFKYIGVIYDYAKTYKEIGDVSTVF